MKTTVQTAAVMLLLVALVQGQAAEKQDELAAKVDQTLAAWDRPDLPGCAVGVIRDGELIYSRGFGTAHLDYEVPNTPQTIFEIGSFSKAFTSLAIALLMDEGKISPDDDLRRYVPEMHEFDPPVRIRHLLRCHSGLWAQWHIMTLAGWGNVPVHSPYTEGDLLTVLSGQKRLPFEPGSEFRYGSGDFFLLGLIVKRVSGKTLAEFSRERIFQPLDMQRTFIEEDPSLIVKHRAVGHIQERDGTWRIWSNHAYLPGGCGVKTCVEDLYRWDQNFDNSRLPAGKYVDEFIADGMVLGNRFCLDSDAYRKKVHPQEQSPPGQYRGLKRIQFTGGVFGMGAAMARFPERRFSVICLVNNDDINPVKITQQIADLYLAADLKTEPSNPEPPQPDQEVALSDEQLKSMVGAYRGDDGTIFQITLRDGQLFNSNSRGETYALKPLGATRFQPTFYPEDTFVFERPSPGEPFSLTLQWDGGSLDMPRVELVDPATLELAEYAGEYFSDELATTYRVRVKDAALWLRVNGRRWERLDPTLRDEFVPHLRHWHENRRIRFRRDENSDVTGLSISFWRVKGVDFERK